MQQLSIDYCEQNKTKKQSARGYKIKCPNCSGNDLWVTESNGRGYCFECSTSYHIGDNAKQQVYTQRLLNIPKIRETYATALSAYRNALQRDHTEYLEKRGIDSHYIDLFQIGFCPPDTIPIYRSEWGKESGLFRIDGIPSLIDRIVFPYLAFGEVTDMRGRCLDNQEPRYKSPFNQSTARGAIYPFNYDRAIRRSKDTGVLVITEGEIKAAVGDIYGFAMIGLPGMSTWRQGFINEFNARIVILFDNSPKIEDKIRIDRSIHKLSQYLPSFYVGVLPLLGEQKMDIDSYLLHPKGGEKRLSYIIDSSLEYERYKLLRRF